MSGIKCGKWVELKVKFVVENEWNLQWKMSGICNGRWMEFVVEDELFWFQHLHNQNYKKARHISVITVY